MICKHLVPLPTTAKGHMKRPRADIRRTRLQAKQPASVASSQGPTVGKANNIFCFAALADKQTGTMYIDATGALSVRLLDNHQYYFVVHNYDTDYTFAIPIKDVMDTIVEAFDQGFIKLTEKGYKPKLSVMNNQATHPIKKYLKREECKWQFVVCGAHKLQSECS